MQLIIKKIHDALNEANTQQASFRTGQDYGSPDETRAIIIQSIFEKIKSDLSSAEAQAKLIEKYLY